MVNQPSNEEVLAEFKISRWILLPQIITSLMFAGIGVAIAGWITLAVPMFIYYLLAAVVVGLLSSAIIRYLTTSITLTNHRVIAKTGFISRSTEDLLLSRIEGTAMNQSLVGRLFNFGAVQVSGVGSAHLFMEGLSNPSAFRRAVAEAMRDHH